MSHNKPITQVELEVSESDLRSRNLTRTGSQPFAVAEVQQADNIHTAQRDAEAAHAQNAFRNNAALQRQFGNFIGNMENFYEMVADEIKEAFDLPKLLADFKALDWKHQILYVLCLSAVTGLLGWATWELVSWLFPKFLKFLESEAGKIALVQLDKYLVILRDAGVIDILMNALQNGVSVALGQNEGPNHVEINAVEVDADELNAAAIQIEETASGTIPEDAANGFVSAYIEWLESTLPR